LLIFSTLEAKTVYGTVVSVLSGDKVKILDSHKKLYMIRLSNIYAPKKNQDFFHTSKKNLSNLIFKKKVYFIGKRIKENYYTGTIYLKSININMEMVRKGLARVAKKYCKNPYYYFLEKRAKNNFIGIWKINKTDTSGYFYQSQRDIIIQPKSYQISFKCGTKRYCRQMSSCKEAYFYMNKCGLHRLDGDGDKIPCESICGH